MTINTLRTSALAGTIALVAFSGTSNAADLAYSPMADVGKWYIGIHSGVNFAESTDFDIAGPANIVNAYDPGFALSGTIGYDAGNLAGMFGVRVEAELGYRSSIIDTHSIAGGAPIGGADAFGETSVLSGMANVLFDVNSGGPIGLYAGGGLGIANVDFEGHGVTAAGVVMDDDSTSLAWQVIAGIDYQLGHSVSLDLQYRFFNVEGVDLIAADATESSTDYRSHSVMAGLRFAF
jgi:opacity protein-like surface antigen